MEFSAAICISTRSSLEACSLFGSRVVLVLMSRRSEHAGPVTRTGLPMTLCRDVEEEEHVYSLMCVM